MSDPDFETLVWQRDEARKAVTEAGKEIARLRASNAELLAALKESVRGYVTDGAHDRACRAIANAEKKRT